MALKIPLVVGTDGYPQQLQSGDTLNAVINIADEITLTNGGGATAPIGTPVYISAASTFQASRANASGTAKAIGFVSATSIAAAGTGAVRKDGTLTATTTQWDAITGQTGGLTVGADYFLDPATAGKMTTTVPSTVGQFIVKLGTAMSTTDFEIEFAPRILL